MSQLEPNKSQLLSSVVTCSNASILRDNFDKSATINPAYQNAEDVIEVAILDRESSKSKDSPFIRKYSNNNEYSRDLEGSSVSHNVCFVLPQLKPWSAPTFHALQEWEGYVTEIDDTIFVARLLNLTAGKNIEDEEAEIPLSLLSDEDRAKLELGSVFRWVVGYERLVTGRKRAGSEIVLLERPALSEQDLKDEETWAQEVMRLFE